MLWKYLASRCFSSSDRVDAYGGSTRLSNGAGSDSYRVTPELPLTGVYRLSAWWPSDASQSSAARYRASGPEGLTEFIADQRVAGGSFSELGTVMLAADGSSYVDISDVGSSKVAADALRFEYLSAQRLVIDAGSMPDAATGSSYSQPSGVSGGQPPYVVSLASGSLPPGLWLDPDNGTV